MVSEYLWNQSIFVHSSGQEMRFSFALEGLRNSCDLSLEICPARITHIREQDLLGEPYLFILWTVDRGERGSTSCFLIFNTSPSLPAPSSLPSDTEAFFILVSEEIWTHHPGSLSSLVMEWDWEAFRAQSFPLFMFCAILAAAILEQSSDGCLGI